MTPSRHRKRSRPRSHRDGRAKEIMADLYLKRLESERKTLWATCRLKGLAKHSPERQRIAELDRLIAEHKAKNPVEQQAPK